jgi:carbonic anhydrase/acetyltransferase-like protein (isoleucine patch superfamily)
MIFPVNGVSPEIHPTAFVHPTAEISGKVRIGPNASIWGACVLRGDIDWIDIGEASNVQDGSVFHTTKGIPVKLGKGVTVGHKAVIHGATVKDYSLIGMGAILLDHAVIEENCLIGAGAVVKEGGVISKGQLALGTPAREKRPLTADEIKMIVDRASDYIRYAADYKKAVAHLK